MPFPSSALWPNCTLPQARHRVYAFKRSTPSTRVINTSPTAGAAWDLLYRCTFGHICRACIVSCSIRCFLMGHYFIASGVAVHCGSHSSRCIQRGIVNLNDWRAEVREDAEGLSRLEAGGLHAIDQDLGARLAHMPEHARHSAANGTQLGR